MFEDFGMSQNATVYFNGREIARFADGFDNEAALQPADIRYGDWNFVTVRLEDEGGRWNWRGIKGDVYLQAKPKTRIEFPAVRTFVKEGKISFGALVKNNTGSSKKLVLRAAVEGENAPEKLESEPFEIGAGEEKQVAFSAKWENAKLWDVDNPYLYGCRFELADARRKGCRFMRALQVRVQNL